MAKSRKYEIIFDKRTISFDHITTGAIKKGSKFAIEYLLPFMLYMSRAEPDFFPPHF